MNMKEEKTCPNCRTSPTMRPVNFCNRCGATMVPAEKCATCSNILYPTDNFCEICGERTPNGGALSARSAAVSA